MKIGFIGIGNMGGAILKGFLKEGICNNDIYIYDISKEHCKKIENQYKVNVCNEYETLIKEIDVLILAVKPDIILNLLSDICVYINSYKPIVISIAAGIALDNIQNVINNDEIGLVRIMPNINAEINLATSAYCYKNLSDEDADKIKGLFEKIGSVFYIQESKFNIFTAIAGCGPAYVYLFLDSLAKGAQKMGLNKKEALNIAIDTLIGSAKMLKYSDKHPCELIDNVCSPGGMTIEGICTLEENNFQSAVVKAIENTIKKDTLLNKSLEERVYGKK